MQETWVRSLVWEDPLVKEMAIYSSILAWASLIAQLVKNPLAMRETWVQSLGWEESLEKGKATHSSILAWRIPWGHKVSDMTEGLSLSFIHSCLRNPMDRGAWWAI